MDLGGGILGELEDEAARGVWHVFQDIGDGFADAHGFVADEAVEGFHDLAAQGVALGGGDVGDEGGELAGQEGADPLVLVLGQEVVCIPGGGVHGDGGADGDGGVARQGAQDVGRGIGGGAEADAGSLGGAGGGEEIGDRCVHVASGCEGAFMQPRPARRATGRGRRAWPGTWPGRRAGGFPPCPRARRASVWRCRWTCRA